MNECELMNVMVSKISKKNHNETSERIRENSNERNSCFDCLSIEIRQTELNPNLEFNLRSLKNEKIFIILLLARHQKIQRSASQRFVFCFDLIESNRRRCRNFSPLFR